MKAIGIDVEDPTSSVALERTRSCDGCTLCCKVMSIHELNKPQGEWCQHCKIGVGCTIYASRPTECRQFFCGYLLLPDLSQEWKPSQSKIVITIEAGVNEITFHVDADRPDAWRGEPFYSYIKERAVRAAPEEGQVLVIIGKRTIMILPDRDVDLGEIRDNELSVTGEQTRGGIVIEPYTMKRNDLPRKQVEVAEAMPTPLAPLKAN